MKHKAKNGTKMKEKAEAEKDQGVFKEQFISSLKMKL